MKIQELVYKLAFALVLVGGFMWLSVGVLEKNFIVELLGETSDLVRVIYTVIGASAVVVTLVKMKTMMEEIDN